MDQLISKHREENPGRGHENKHSSAKPSVVRTLKDPPEIWDLVHETPAHFNPGGAFVGRLTSSKTTLILFMLGVMFISGLAALGVMKLRDGRRSVGAAAQLQQERGTSQTVPASQANAPASAPESALNARVNARANEPVDAPVNAPVLNTSPGAESVVDNTPPQLTAPPPIDPQAGRASGSKPLNNSIQQTGVSEAQAQASGPVVNNISTRTALLPRRAVARSGNKRVTVASGRQNADKPADELAPARGESEPATAPDTSAKPQTPQAPQRADPNGRYEKSSDDSTSANKRSNPTLSPQLIAPPTTTSAPKAKVIQWP